MNSRSSTAERAPYKRGVVSSILTGSILLSLISSCAVRLYSPSTGKPLAVIQSNATHVSYTGGGVTFSADTLDNATPSRVAWHGLNRVAATLASAGVAIAIPGSTAVPLVSKAAIGIVPSFTAPTSPAATPAPTRPVSAQ